MTSAIASSRMSAASRSMAWASVRPSAGKAKFEMVVMPPASAACDPVR
ncbi:hypothetical protein [Candidatus Palauibacter sp.]